MVALTRRQREMYDFLCHFTETHGYSPSFEEIAEGMGLSSLATVHKHVGNLEEKGLLKRDYNRARSIEVLRPKGQLKKSFVAAAAAANGSLPLMGRIAAGQLNQAFQNQDTISLGDITGSRDVFVLEVAGDSMIDEHIVEGDYVLVERVNTARDGEMVVALVNNSDATLKRIYREGETTRLQPSNARMEAIRVPADSVQIQGRIIGVLRKY
jgi:repressor LexA